MVEFHPEAEKEYHLAVDWYLERSFQASFEFAQSVEDAIRCIEESPHRWPRYLYGTQRYLLNRFPYSVVYFQTLTGIKIIALAHAARRPGYWSKRA